MRLDLYMYGAWRTLESDSNKNTLVLNWNFDSLESPSSYYSDFSYAFRAPRTASNDRLFALQCRLDSIGGGNVSLAGEMPYRLYGEKSECISTGVAKVTSWNNDDYSIQLSGSLGIAFKALLNSGFDASNSDPNYYVLPDYLNYDGNGGYTASTLINRFTVGCSWNVDSLLIPFGMDELRGDYGNLVNLYYLDQLQQYTERHAWAASLVGFMPQTQGRYKQFESTKWTWNGYIYPLFQTPQQTQEIPVGDGLNEYQMSQFRSYYQTPFVYVQKLWEMYREHCAAMTGYTLSLDERWYNEGNNDLRDLVYTLPNLGYNLPERIDPVSTASSTIVSNVSMPVNSAFNYNDYTIQNLRTNVHQYFYSGYYNVAKNQTFECITQIPIRFTNPDGVFFVSYPVEQLHPPIDKAWNSLNPIVATYDILDSNNNVVASSIRPIALVPLLKNSQVTEEWDHPLREAIETIYDVICFYYDGEQIYDNRTVADFGEVQITARWKNNAASQLVRVRWNLSFMYDQCPFKIYVYAQGGSFEKVISGYGYTGGNASSFATWNINGSRQVNIYDPVRSDSKITMERLFRSESPFSILLKYSKMMNLVWLIDDEQKKITVKRKYDYFYDCVNTNSGHYLGAPSYQGFLDLTDFIDVSKDLVVSPLAFDGRVVNLGFKESADMNCHHYKEKFGKVYGSLLLYTADKSSKETIEAFNKDDNSTLYPPIVATDIVSPRDVVEQLQSAKYETFPFPSNITDSGETAGVSGVFYFRCASKPVPDDEFAHYRDSGNTPYVLITDDEPVEVSDDVYCYHYDGTSNALDKRQFPQYLEHNRDCTTSLFFGEPREMYYNCEQQALDTDISIYRKNWQRWLEDSYSVNNKALVCFAWVDSAYYMRLKSNPLIKIMNAIYLAQKIEFSSDNYMKLELRQIYDLGDLITDATPVPTE